MTTGLALALNAAFVLAIVVAFTNSGKLLGPKPAHEGDGWEPYETGMKPIEPAIDRMSVLYYRFAVLFVVFDVDLAFLLPWALTRPSFGLREAVVITVFTGLLGLMLAYFWRKGLLECA